ncbi:MAG TPA: 50S ribosomal protein L29 [Bacteroidetes bacterium]|nr:50S ribosomal protein L29 [Bacteroidota bacterium]
MASKKFLELQEFTDVDLENELKEAQAEYTKLKFDHSVAGLENPMVLRSLRRDIARLQSEVRRRELAGMSEEQIQKRDKIRLRRKLKNK